MKKFRIEHGSVYEYSADNRAYIFCGKLNGQDATKWIFEHLYQSPPNYMTTDEKYEIEAMTD